MKKQIVLLLLTMIMSSSLFAQKEIGKIFTKAEADSLYGKVIESYTMSSDSLLSLLKETGDKVMFKLREKKAIITSNTRKVLFPKGGSVDSREVLRVWSTSKVIELIALGRNDVVELQTRDVTTTLENGSFVLEVGLPCPPICD